MIRRCLWCYSELPKSRTKPREFCRPSCKMAYKRNVRHIFQRYELSAFTERVKNLMVAAIDGASGEALAAVINDVREHPLFISGSQAGEPDNSSVRDGRGTSPLATPITEG